MVVLELPNSKLKKYRRMLKADPDSLDAAINLGLLHFKKGMYDEAAGFLEKAIRIKPDLVEARNVLGSIYIMREEYARAEQILLEALELRPYDFDTLSQLGHLFCTLNQMDRALEFLLQAAKVNPHSEEILNDIGVLFYSQGKQEEAECYFHASLKEKNNYADAYYNLGLLYFEQSKYEKAIEAMRRCVALEPDSDETWQKIGLFYQKVENFSASLAAFEQVKGERGPELNYSLGGSWYASGHWDRAIEAFERCLEAEPDHILAKQGLAACFSKKGNWERVSALCSTFLSCGQPAPPAIDNLSPRLSAHRTIRPLRIIKRIEARSEQADAPSLNLSIVVPVYNEEQNINILYEQLQSVLLGLNKSYEIIFVDDGSNDRTLENLRKISDLNRKVKVISFRRNYGQTAALAAGFDLARGEVIITLDGDLQNDPQDIPRLLDKMAEGYDLVSGWRTNRQDKFLTRKIPSQIANRIIAKLTNVHLHDYGCTLKAYKKGIIKNIKLYGEMHRFIPALASFLGIKVTELPVNHRPRVHGSSKYGLSRIYRVILDLINVRFLLDYFTRPIQFFGKLALGTFGFGLTALLVSAVMRYILGVEINFLVVGIMEVIIFLTGIQLVMMGLVGEMVIRTYHESQDKPIYIVREIIQPEDKD
ncbi:MAG: glycosyltransferase [Thermodesulfobacteriota bacterium]